MSSSRTIVIYCTDEVAARTIHQSVPAKEAQDVAFSSRRALDGDIATWVMIATLGLSALKIILKTAIRFAELRRVRSIKVGDIEIQNPDRADVERLLAHIEAVTLDGPSIKVTDKLDSDDS